MKKTKFKPKILHMVVAPFCPFCMEEGKHEVDKFFDEYLAYPVCKEHSEKFSEESSNELNVN